MPTQDDKRPDPALPIPKDELLAEVEFYRSLTPKQAAWLREKVVKDYWKAIQDRPDRKQILDHRDPPAPDFERIWRRLNEQYRAMTNKS